MIRNLKYIANKISDKKEEKRKQDALNKRLEIIKDSMEYINNNKLGGKKYNLNGMEISFEVMQKEEHREYKYQVNTLSKSMAIFGDKSMELVEYMNLMRFAIDVEKDYLKEIGAWD